MKAWWPLLQKLIIIFVVSLCAHWIATSWLQVDATSQDSQLALNPPSWKHPFGLDALGRDSWIRVWDGLLTSMVIATCATVGSLVLGLWIGITSGYYGGWIDAIGLFLIRSMGIMPSLVLTTLMGLAFGRGRDGMILALLLTQWTQAARVFRAETQSLRTETYMEAARTMGMTTVRLWLRELLPNLGPSIQTQASLLLPTILLTESLLSFVGLGLPPPSPTLGGLIQDGIRVMSYRPHALVFPALAFLCLLQYLSVRTEHPSGKVAAKTQLAKNHSHPMNSNGSL